MPESCPVCRKALEPEHPVFQIAEGFYWSPQITPTYGHRQAVIGEWHESCFRQRPCIRIGEGAEQQDYKIVLKMRLPPYTCMLCSGEIESGEKIFYGVIGSRPEPGYIRPQARGYGLFFAAHSDCWRRPGTTEIERELRKSRSIDRRYRTSWHRR